MDKKKYKKFIRNIKKIAKGKGKLPFFLDNSTRDLTEEKKQKIDDFIQKNEKELRIRKIGKKISETFTFEEIKRAKEDLLKEPNIVGFIIVKYRDFINDIVDILIIADKISGENKLKRSE
ncbi:hypothetical protein LCGC14_0956660 [marine sediment metagenome]|uniref:Uncharacterized protein n=1 Tax=marine sediment metagenome TaxID=412755 RepID=A0A0F9QZ14_9ZZZZ